MRGLSKNLKKNSLNVSVGLFSSWVSLQDDGWWKLILPCLVAGTPRARHSFSLLCTQGQVHVFDVSAPSVPCVVIIIIRTAASNSVFSHIAVM